MNEIDPQHLRSPQPLDRLEALGRGTLRRKPEGGPLVLLPKHKLLVAYMIDGCGHQSICDRIWIERKVATEEGTAVVRRRPHPHEPLTLLEAADLLRIRRRNARELMTLPVFQAAYNAELERYRKGEHAASLRTLVDVRDDPGLGKAADRKVQLAASAMILGELGNAGPSVTINNNVGGVTMQAGVVIQRWQDDDEIEASTRTIEHESTP